MLAFAVLALVASVVAVPAPAGTVKALPVPSKVSIKLPPISLPTNLPSITRIGSGYGIESLSGGVTTVIGGVTLGAEGIITSAVFQYPKNKDGTLLGAAAGQGTAYAGKFASAEGKFSAIFEKAPKETIASFGGAGTAAVIGLKPVAGTVDGEVYIGPATTFVEFCLGYDSYKSHAGKTFCYGPTAAAVPVPTAV